jgi:hypothetical protein
MSTIKLVYDQDGTKNQNGNPTVVNKGYAKDVDSPHYRFTYIHVKF